MNGRYIQEGVKMKKSLVGRALITFIGFAFLIWGICLVTLGIFGEDATAVLTSIRRQGGERNESVPGRYTYSIGYTFTLPDNQQIDGTATIISSALYTKVEGNSTIMICYLSALPWINAPVELTNLYFGQPLVICIGVFLIWVVNKTPRRGRKRN